MINDHYMELGRLDLDNAQDVRLEDLEEDTQEEPQEDNWMFVRRPLVGIQTRGGYQGL